MASLREIVDTCNSFWAPSSSRTRCRPLEIDGVPVGLIRFGAPRPAPWGSEGRLTMPGRADPALATSRPDVLHVLAACPDVFVCSPRAVTFVPALTTEAERSAALAQLLARWRAADLFPSSLRGWRDELYPVVLRGSIWHAPLALQLERAAVGLFGFTSYGVHINGYTVDAMGAMKLWIARRSATKPTWPNYLDNFVRQPWGRQRGRVPARLTDPSAPGARGRRWACRSPAVSPSAPASWRTSSRSAPKKQACLPA